MCEGICILSERLARPFDQGIKHFADDLIKELSKSNNILILSMAGNKTDETCIKRLNINKTFLSYSLFREISSLSPVVVRYIPSPSVGIFSFMPTKVVKPCTRKAKAVMIALQPREYSLLSRKLIPVLIPDLTNGERSFVDVGNDIVCKALAKYYSSFRALVKAILHSNPAQWNG